jgi:hypothetical protein
MEISNGTAKRSRNDEIIAAETGLRSGHVGMTTLHLMMASQQGWHKMLREYNGLDLDLCESPDDVIALLHRAADKFNQDAGELQSAWQDKNAGKFWERLARDLSRLASKAEGYNY